MAEYRTEKWLDLGEAAAHARYSAKTIQRWIEDPSDPLPALRDGRGGKIVIGQSELDAYMRRRAHEGVQRRRTHFVTHPEESTPTACGRMRDGTMVSASLDEVTCKTCLMMLGVPDEDVG